MAATWLTELLLDTLNRALLQQGGGDELPSSSSDMHDAQEPSESRSAYQQVRQLGCRVLGWVMAALRLAAEALLKRQQGNQVFEGFTALEQATAVPVVMDASHPLRIRCCLSPPPAQAVERLRSFLQKYVDVLDPGTTIGLLAGYGRLVRDAGGCSTAVAGAGDGAGASLAVALLPAFTKVCTCVHTDGSCLVLAG